MDPFRQAELTDALARGRLAPAEIAAMPPRELEALFETAARCLDAAQDEMATRLLGGLITLFPFSARYWRAYAIALHRCLLIECARAAYEASLALEPGHELTRCYHAEILIYLGYTDRAQRELHSLLGAEDPVTGERAAELLRQLDTLARWEAPAPEPETDAPPEADRPHFRFDDRRDLPLEPSAYGEVEEPTEPMAVRQITRMAADFAPIADEPTAPFPRPGRTNTSLVPRRAGRTATNTALLPGRKGRPLATVPEKTATGTVTALLPGREKRASAAATEEPNVGVGEVPVGGHPERPFSLEAGAEPTLTAAVERRAGDPPGAGDDPEVEVTVTAAVMRRDGCLTFDRED